MYFRLRRPTESFLSGGEICQRKGDLTKVPNEPPVKIGKFFGNFGKKKPLSGYLGWANPQQLLPWRDPFGHLRARDLNPGTEPIVRETDTSPSWRINDPPAAPPATWHGTVICPASPQFGRSWLARRLRRSPAVSRAPLTCIGSSSGKTGSWDHVSQAVTDSAAPVTRSLRNPPLRGLERRAIRSSTLIARSINLSKPTGSSRE